MAGFFDNLINNLNNGIGKVADSSKSMVEKTKLNSLIKKVENEKQQYLQAVGTTLYDFMINTTEGDFPREKALEICTIVAQKDQEIETLKAQVAALNAAELSQSEDPMQQTMPQQQTAMSQENPGLVCSCGFVNAPGARFCARCGNKFE